MAEAISAATDVAMEPGSEDQEIADFKFLITTGTVLSSSPTMLFLAITLENGEKETCFVRPHRIFIDGLRIKSSEVRTKERLEAFISERLSQRQLNIEVCPNPRSGEPFAQATEGGVSVQPKYYSHCLWTGSILPPLSERRPKWSVQKSGQSSIKVEGETGECDAGTAKDMDVDVAVPFPVNDKQGTIVYHNAKGEGFVAFTQADSTQEEFAKFHMRDMFVNGQFVMQKEYHSWPLGKRIDVSFNAVRLSAPVKAANEKVVNVEDGSESVLSFSAMFHCVALWVGEKPTQEKLKQTMKNLPKSCRTNANTFERERIKDCEYQSCVMDMYLDHQSGLLCAKGERYIHFKVENLVINGVKFDSEKDDLTESVYQGEQVFAYIRKLEQPFTAGQKTVAYEAEKCWKGSRKLRQSDSGSPITPSTLTSNPAGVGVESMQTGGSEMPEKKGRRALPLPSAATFFDVKGTITDLPTGQHGIVDIVSPEMAGQKVLLPRSRVFINGAKLKGREFLPEHFKTGDAMFFNMVKGDEDEAEGKYAWVAVVAWPATSRKPTTGEVEEINRLSPMRGKILAFGPRSDELGMTCGIAVVTNVGKNKGEKVYFSRQETYIYGNCMENADLYHLVKEGDKVFFVMKPFSSEEEQQAISQKFGCDITYCASPIWIGQPPKADPKDGCLGNVHAQHLLLPYLSKRNLDESSFVKLIAGQLPPKKYIPPQGPVSLDDEADSSQVATARFLEILKPNADSFGEASKVVTQGILVLETGPFAGQKAFINRSGITLFGHRMSSSDLMYFVNSTDKYKVIVSAESKNKVVPHNIGQAWIGPGPDLPDRKLSASMESADFVNFITDHAIDSKETFLAIVNGLTKPRPFFPLPGEIQNARVTCLYPARNPLKMGSGVTYGMLKIHQGSLEKKDVLFDRDSTYLHGVRIAAGDLSYLITESTKVNCEVSELFGGRERKIWQSRLGTDNIPKYVATMVWVGGGRPKNDPSVSTLAEMNKNTNLLAWLKKRKMDTNMLLQLISGNLLPKRPDEPLLPPPPSNRPSLPMGIDNGAGARLGGPLHQQSPFRGPPSKEGSPAHMARGPGLGGSFDTHQMLPRPGWERRAPGSSEFDQESFENPIMLQARSLLTRVMACRSADDPAISEVVKDPADVRLAMFIARTLEGGVAAYEKRGQRGMNPKPGPIAPPSRRDEFSLFTRQSASSSVYHTGSGGSSGNGMASRSNSARMDGLFGLPKPLMADNAREGDFSNDSLDSLGWRSNSLLRPNPDLGRPPMRRESPVEFSLGTQNMEPPYKRKSANNFYT